MRSAEAADRAILEMTVLDGRDVKVEKARRTQGYEKTPGRCKICFYFIVIFSFIGYPDDIDQYIMHDDCV
jgi:hypothetical protein